jgi:hypothetical protein
MNKYSLLFLLLSFSATVNAQTKCACCTDVHNQFNFWVGEWFVYDSTETHIGENTIVKIEKNCILTESWRSATGGSGSSFNYFDLADSTWNQIWVDGDGKSLVLKGKAVENKIVLKSKLLPGKKVKWYYNQITWTKNSDGSVTQLWEIFDKKNRRISVAFKGLYKQK